MHAIYSSVEAAVKVEVECAGLNIAMYIGEVASRPLDRLQVRIMRGAAQLAFN
jgi:hypothetical protein